MTSLLRESIIGQTLNWASSGRILSYPEQRSGYIVDSKWLKGNSSNSTGSDRFPRSNTGATLVNAEGAAAPAPKEGALPDDLEKAVLASEPLPEAAIDRYPYLVEWEENDPDNPL